MSVKTAKQIEEERAGQVEQQDREAQEAMAARAQGNDEEVNTANENEVGSDDAELGVWSNLLEEEDEDTSTVDNLQEEPDDTGEETDAGKEGEEVSSTSEEEGEEAKPDEQVADTSEKPDTGEEEEVEVPVAPEQQASEDVRSPEQVREELQKARENAREKLQEQFKLTEEQEDEFRESPNNVLPQMAAELYLNLFDDMVKVIQTQVPMMMEQTTRMQEQKKANEQKFFRAWPQLAKPEYMDTINRIADNYRNMHPNADPEEAVKEIGAQAWIALRLPLDELARHAEGAEEEQEVVDKVTSINSGRKPSGPGKAAQANLETNTTPRNEYERLADELLFEDDM